MQIPRHQVPEAPADLVPHDRLADGAAHDEPDLRGLIAAHPRDQVTDYQRPPVAASALDRIGEVCPATHARGFGQHRTPPSRRRRGAGQTLTRARPLRRRAASTARPALVRMRSRNPCVFARRRLFGWNVRLLTGNS